MPTWARSATSVFCPGPCPWTSADGLSTRRYSAGRLKLLPSSKETSSRFSARLRRSWIGQGAPLPALIAGSRLRRPLVVPQLARLVDQHDRNAVADRIGEPRLLADQLLRLAVVAQRRLGQRTDQNLQQFRIDLGGFFHGRLPRGCSR